jgi:type VI secretion system protein ImpC
VEEVSGQNHDEYLWMNAAYAFGTRLTNAFDMHGWCAAIRGVEGGGMVEGLPVHTLKPMMVKLYLSVQLKLRSLTVVKKS